MDKKDRKDPTSLDVHGAPLTQEQAETFRSLVKSTSKSFVVAASLGISVVSAMIHYYRVYKQTDEYKILKERLGTEMDLCWMCDDGGDLLMCDSCDRGYHPDCLDPPLSVIPEGEWKCPLCAKKEDRRRRSSISSASSTAAKPANKCRIAGCTRFKQHNRDGMCIYHYKQNSDTGVDADDSSIATLDSSVATNVSVSSRQKGHKHCRIAGCSKYKQHQCEGFCKNHYKEEMDKRAEQEKQQKISSPKPNSKCRIEGCNKFKQYGCDGMCRAHYNDANGEEDLSQSDALSTLKCGDSSNKKRSIPTVGTRRSPRTSPGASNVDESRIIDMTVFSDDSEEETWECIRCNESVPVGRFRCTGCKAWKDGKRPTKGSTSGNDDNEEETWECIRCNESIPVGRFRCTGWKAWKDGKRPTKGSASGNDDSEEETWECIRCNELVPTGRFRCTACKAWKDGKRPTKGSTSGNDDNEEETWECIRCNESIPVGRFRCTACKAWKDGKRPTKGSPGGNESA